jgi:succinoglycan biosynthesis protein ExoA
VNLPREQSRGTPSVSVVVPCRNEIAHIQSFLDSLLAQDLRGLDVEIIIADGMSVDGTRDVLRDFEEEHPQIQVIENPSRIVSAGLNAAIRSARGDIIVRMDVHTQYKADYIRRCVENLNRTRAENVGGACIAVGRGCLGRAIASAFHSAFSVGGARWHRPSHKGFVETVHLGCWRRETLLRIGLFDESLVRNQDDELNLRLSRSGGKIWQSPDIVSWYRPRSSLSALFRQYLQYGFWKVAVIRKHRLPASYRHLIPALFILANLAAFAMALFGTFAGYAFLKLIALGVFELDAVYVLVSLAFSFLAARRDGWLLFPFLPFVFATYHVAYGLGFLCGMLCFSIRARPILSRRGLFSNLTR